MSLPEDRRPSADPAAAALVYARLGWRVLPIKPGEKRPPMAAWQDAASSDPATIDSWWGGLYAGHGVGIATGPGSGIFVLDVDVADGKRGDESLADLTDSYAELPHTVEAETGSGGRHIFFRWPAGMEIRNSASTRLGPGLDIRGRGGQVVVSPTTHPNGQRYRWVIGHEPDVTAVAEAPGWLLALLQADEKPQVAPPVRQTVDPDDMGPADRFNAATTWDDLLSRDGWTLGKTQGGEQHWTRPGKSTRDGTSATVGYKGNDALHVFTSSVPGLEPDRSYSKFAYVAATRHSGDQSACAHALIAAGYGRPAVPVDLSWLPDEVVEPVAEPGWPDQPTPLHQATRSGPPFPLEVLPEWISDQCRAVAESFQVPVDMPATFALGALSTVAAGHLKVNLTGSGWTEHTNLYLVVAMPPGAGKSPVYKVMTRPVVELEKELMGRRRKERREAETRKELLEGQARNAEKVALSGGDTEQIMRAVQLRGDADDITVPPSGQLVAEDITPEALVELLAENDGRMALLSSEGGVFDMMAGQYVERGKATNLQVYLQGWSADAIRRKRVKAEAQIVDEAILTVCVATQPGVVASLARNPELVTRGVPVRFMFSLPPSLVGWRDRRRVLDEIDRDAAKAYSDALYGLGERMSGWAASVMRLAPEATDRFIAWDQDLEDRQRPGGDLVAMAEWISKLRASALRVVGLLHIAGGGHVSDPIPDETMARALVIADYWLAHARLVHEMWGADPVLDRARSIVEWALGADLDGLEFSLRDAQAAMKHTFTSAEELVGPLTWLVEQGWVRPHQDLPVRPLGKGRPSQRFTLRADAARWLEASVAAPQAELFRVVPGERNNLQAADLGERAVVPVVPVVPIDGLSTTTTYPQLTPDPSPWNTEQPEHGEQLRGSDAAQSAPSLIGGAVASVADGAVATTDVAGHDGAADEDDGPLGGGTWDSF